MKGLQKDFGGEVLKINLQKVEISINWNGMKFIPLASSLKYL
jgi:hypothetical protein